MIPILYHEYDEVCDTPLTIMTMSRGRPPAGSPPLPGSDETIERAMNAREALTYSNLRTLTDGGEEVR